MKTSAELLREYSSLIKEAEDDDFDASDFDSNDPDDFEEMNRNEADDYKDEFEHPEVSNSENNPVQELADFIDNYKDDTADWPAVISQFLKEKHYDLVPTNSLENSTGNV